jgi:hypothetical protein
MIREVQETLHLLSPEQYDAFMKALRLLCVKHRVRLETSEGQVCRMLVQLSEEPGFDYHEFRNADTRP